MYGAAPCLRALHFVHCRALREATHSRALQCQEGTTALSTYYANRETMQSAPAQTTLRFGGAKACMEIVVLKNTQSCGRLEVEICDETQLTANCSNMYKPYRISRRCANARERESCTTVAVRRATSAAENKYCPRKHSCKQMQCRPSGENGQRAHTRKT